MSNYTPEEYQAFLSIVEAGRNRNQALAAQPELEQTTEDQGGFWNGVGDIAMGLPQAGAGIAKNLIAQPLQAIDYLHDGVNRLGLRLNERLTGVERSPEEREERLSSLRENDAFRIPTRAMGAAGRALESSVDAFGDLIGLDRYNQMAANTVPRGSVLSPSTWEAGEDPSWTGAYHLAIQTLTSYAPEVAGSIFAGIPGAMIMGGLSSAGAKGREEEQRISETPVETLAENSQYFRDMLSDGVEPERARQEVAKAASAAAAAKGFVVDGAGGAAFGYILNPRFLRHIKSTPARMTAGAVAGGAIEGTQEVFSTMSSRAASAAAIGEDDRVVDEGTFGDFVLGGAMGAGGGAHGAFNQTPETPESPEASKESPKAWERPSDDTLQNRRGESSIDAMIAEADRGGFHEEAVRLRNVKSIFDRAYVAQESDPELSERLKSRGQAILDSLFPTQEPQQQLGLQQPEAQSYQPQPMEADAEYAADDGINTLMGDLAAIDHQPAWRMPDEGAEAKKAARDQARATTEQAFTQQHGEAHAPYYGEFEPGYKPNEPSYEPEPIEGEVIRPESAFGLQPEQQAAQQPLQIPQDIKLQLGYEGDALRTPDDVIYAEMPPELRQQVDAELQYRNQVVQEGIAAQQEMKAIGQKAMEGQQVEPKKQQDAQAQRQALLEKINAANEVLALNKQKPLEAEQQQGKPKINAIQGKKDRAFTPDNEPVDFHYALVEADELNVSHDANGRENPNYPQELQQRERENAASQAQIRKIAAELNPELLADNKIAKDGAPIIGADGVVESGNGRSAALRLAYQEGTPKAEEYRQYLRARAQDLGLPVGNIDQMQKPVLVRVREGDAADRKDFTRKANKPTEGVQNTFEKSRTDAEKIDDGLMRLWNPSETDGALSASNLDFVRGFAQKLGQAEAQGLLKNDGTASHEMANRIDAAIFHKAYENDRLTEFYTDLDGPYKNLIKSMKEVAPKFATAKTYNPELTGEVTNTISKAFDVAEQARLKKLPIQEFLAQQDAFSQTEPETARLASLFSMNRSKPARLNDILTTLATQTEGEAKRSLGGDMFGYITTGKDLINEAERQADQKQPETASDAMEGAREGEPAGDGRATTDPVSKGVEADAGGRGEILAPAQPEPARTEVEPEAFVLTQQTEQEARQQRQEQQQAQEAKAKAEREAEQREQADSEVDDFVLTGSNSKIDQMEARGQSNLFDQPAQNAELEQARVEVDTSPTEVQKEAGNYKKGHVNYQGLSIALENPKGSERSGTDAGGKAWSVNMAHDYGYIKRTEGADGDQVDVFIGDSTESDKVFVVDQINPDGSFDEHKVMLGFDSREAAEQGYLANYEKGWQGMGAITEASIDGFKGWIKEGDTTKPYVQPEQQTPVQADLVFAQQLTDAASTGSYIKNRAALVPEFKKAGLPVPKTKADLLAALPELAEKGDQASIKQAMGLEQEQAGASSTTPIADLPEIIALPKKQYLAKKIKETGIKKQSPGYADAVDRIESEYDQDLDRAYAGLPFEQYNELNKDIPESINRQAHDALKEDFGIQQAEQKPNQEPKVFSTKELEDKIVRHLLDNKGSPGKIRDASDISNIVNSFFSTMDLPNFYSDLPAVKERYSNKDAYRNQAEQRKNIDPERIKQALINEAQSAAKESKLDNISKAISDKKREKAEKLKALLQSRKGTLNSGIDPEVMLAVAEVGALSIAEGAVKFAQFVRDTLNTTRAVGIDDADVKPFLKEAYGAIASNPEKYEVSDALADEMDTPREIRKMDIDALVNEKTNEDNQNVDLTAERKTADSRNRTDAQQEAGADIQNEGRGRGEQQAGGTRGAAGGGRQQAGDAMADSLPTTQRERSYQPVHGAEPKNESSPSRSADDGRGIEDSTGGLLADAEPTKAADDILAEAPVKTPRVKVSSGKFKSGDLAQVKEQMPFLTEGQAQDVVFAEQRFDKGGLGVMFTNGTGTGKTFTGLGIAKRQNLQGKKNILIITPSQPIVSAWVDAAKDFFDLDAYSLSSTQDNGAGHDVVVTTYANMAQNPALMQRDWDLIIPDEAHKLSSDKDGSVTESLKQFRALAKQPGTHYQRADMLNPELKQEIDRLSDQIESNRKSDDERNRQANTKLEQQLGELMQKRQELVDEQKQLLEKTTDADRAKATFLSATPFAYEMNVVLGQGFLYDWNKGREDNLGSRPYNSGDNFSRFMMEHFGYRMRYNKLTQPEASVNRELMQRVFNSWLKKEGVLSGRTLESEHDYDRLFIKTDSAIGSEVDRALEWVREQGSNAELGDLQSDFRDLSDNLGKAFDYQSRMYFLEALKAREAMPFIQSQLDAGRKVLVIHDFNKGGTTNPFRVSDKTEAGRMFREEFADLISSFDYIGSPVAVLSKAFPDALIYNGKVSGKNRVEMQNQFNDDNGASLIIAQGDAMKEGVSVHDRTGEHPRVLVHLGMPVKPTAAIQQEGRIYRTGQASDAMFRYMTIGTNWERHTFASTIAGRASTAENLAMGEEARGLKESFISAYEEADNYQPGFEGEGKGGKEKDRSLAGALSPWDMAKSLYFGTKKQGKGRNAAGREQSDYFATPEPVGMKMVQLADIRANDKVLEPSAGHGAIARFFPEYSDNRAIELTDELASRLALRFDGDKVIGRFEDHNIINKYDAIVMNPPFGQGGKLAAEHVAKAATHLRDNGRIVALIPRGPAADKRFDKLLEDLKDVYQVGEVLMPPSTFERAGTSVSTRIIVLEKQTDPETAKNLRSFNRDYSQAENINELFDRMETMEGTQRILKAEPEAEPVVSADQVDSWEAKHTKTGEPLFMAKHSKKLSREEYSQAADIAKRNNGYWSRFGKAGFLFKTEADRQSFIDEVSGQQAEGDTVRHKLGESGAGIDAATLKQSLKDELGGLADLASVVQSADSLPQGVKDHAAANGIGLDQIKGVWHNGKAYIVADNLNDAAEAARTVLHEAVGHQGIHGVLGDSLKPTMDNIYRSFLGTPLLRDLKKTYPHLDANTAEGRRILAEELVAHLAENNTKPNLFGKFVAAVKSALRKLFPNLKFSESDVNALIQKAREHVQNSDPSKISSNPVDTTRYSLRDRLSELRNRKKSTNPLNDKLRESDKTAFDRLKKNLQRWVMPGGLMPQTITDLVRQRNRDVQTHENDVGYAVAKLDEAMKAAGLTPRKLTDPEWQKYHDYLTGQNDGADLTQREKDALNIMREHVDGLTREYVATVTRQLEQNAEKGEINQGELERLQKMTNNIGQYLNRSYRAFDDPSWHKKLTDEVIENARAYLINRYTEGGMSKAEATNRAEVALHEIVKTGTAYDNLGSFITEGKLGAKDLSMFIKRKQIAPEILALLGEYKDPRINYAKSVAKMSSLIANDRLLHGIKDVAMGSFIFEKDTRPPEATVQLAGEKSDVYSPLNGMWTTPEIKQAFEDAMGQTPEGGWLSAVIKMNGLIKYGKTVLSPTTAMRNLYSSLFFNVANGHFDILSNMKKAKVAWDAQVAGKTTQEQMKYIRKLTKLGVIYDGGNSGELVRMMTDGKIQQLLEKGGSAFATLNWMNQKALGFYRFGDDFWKVIGWENEKAVLIEAGFSEAEAEKMAAERIQDTYPTYSRVPKGGVWLSRFPLAGTFVSFPAEIIRTSANMIRLTASDYKSGNPQLKKMAVRRMVGMGLASGGMFALQALTKAMFGVSDDEEEALRDLAPPWQKNSTFIFTGRDKDGNLRYFDMTFLDPYGYWKRPIEALLRDQPWEDALTSSLKDMITPFIGIDIAFGTVLEVVKNKKASGGEIYKPNDGVFTQSADISTHLARGFAPGIANNIWRTALAAGDVKRSSGQPYSMYDEMLAWAGFRASTFDPGTSLYYRTFDFNEAAAEARRELTAEMRNPNSRSDGQIKAAWARAQKKQDEAFREMSRLVQASIKSGMTDRQVVQMLSLAGISKRNIAFLMRGETPPLNISDQSFRAAYRRAQIMMNDEAAKEVRSRFRRIIESRPE